MDPKANLDEQLALAQKQLYGETLDDDEVTRLAELVEALYGWIKNGGSVPKL